MTFPSNRENLVADVMISYFFLLLCSAPWPKRVSEKRSSGENNIKGASQVKYDECQKCFKVNNIQAGIKIIGPSCIPLHMNQTSLLLKCISFGLLG